jgi:hypothetical protein
MFQLAFAIAVLQSAVSCNDGVNEIRERDQTIGKATNSADPLPSWNDGNVKRSITTYVQKSYRLLLISFYSCWRSHCYIR